MKKLRLITTLCAIVAMMAAGITVILSGDAGSKYLQPDIATVLATTNGTPIVYTGAGDGSAGNPWRIGDATTLQNRLATTAATAANRNFVLTSDINLSGINWTPRFLAAGTTFDGNHYAIRNLTIDRAAANQGFFNTALGTVRNVTFENPSIRTSNFATAGVVSAQVTGTTSRFENINVTSTNPARDIRSTIGVGAIVGVVNGGSTIIGCYNNATVAGSENVGGLVGQKTGTGTLNISYSINQGSISIGSVNGKGGGIVGDMSNGTLNIEWCINRGEVSAAAATVQFGAGILGRYNAGTAAIRNSFSDGELKIEHATRSGIAGRSAASALTITNSYFNSDLTPTGTNASNATTGVTGNTAATRRTSVNMRNQQFIDLMNTGQGAPVYVMDTNGVVTLRAFNNIVPATTMWNHDVSRIYMFRSNATADYEIFYIHQGHNDNANLVLPNITNKPEFHRTGYIFTGWQRVAGATHNAGDSITTAQRDYVTFIAQYRPAVYEVRQFMSEGVTESRDISFTIANPTVTMPAVGDTWLIKMGNRTSDAIINYTVILNPADTLTFTINETFLRTHAYYHETQQGGIDGYIMVRVLGSSVTHEPISVTANMNGAGVATVRTNNGEARIVLTDSSSFTLWQGDTIESIDVVANDHYRFVEVNEVSGAYIVTFEKIQYNFHTIARLEDGEILTQIGQNISETKSVIRVGESISLSATIPADNNPEFSFVRWKILTTQGYVYPANATDTTLNISETEIDALWLELHLTGEQVIIIAEYIRLQRVQIELDASLSAFGSLRIIVIDGQTGEQSTHNSVDSFMPVGSLIRIQAIAEEFYEFSHFVGTDVEVVGNAIEIQITENIENISAVFKHKQFNVIFDARDRDIGSSIRNVSGFQDTSVHLNSKLAAPATAPEIVGYRFIGYEILDASGNAEALVSSATELDRAVLIQNLDRMDNFTIRAIYVRTFDLNFLIDGPVTDEDFEIIVMHKDIETSERTFDRGEEVEVHISVAKHGQMEFFRLNGFAGVAQQTEVIANNELNLTMGLNRTVTIRFLANEFDLSKNLVARGNGKLDIDREVDLKVGHQIQLFATAGDMQEIRKWNVNGINLLNTKNLPSNIERRGDNVIITLTAEWLEVHGTAMNSTVEFKLQRSVIIITVFAAVLILALAGGVSWNVINVRKTNARIKKMLMDKKGVTNTFGMGGFVSDLRDGKDVGNITKKEIKQALKDEKDSQK
jgi:hypothetical protein